MVDRGEASLVQKAVAGDRAALASLLQTHQQRLHNVVLRMLPSPDDAADVTQEALFKVVQHIADYRGRSSLGTWMVRIAMNLALSHLRRQRQHPSTTLDAPSDSAASLCDTLPDTREPDPALSVQNKEQAHAVLSALARLDDDFRAVITLRDLDAMSYEDIASVLSIPVGTVKSRLFRARLALRQEVLVGPGASPTLADAAVPRPAAASRSGGQP
jgi:RNA polymerase sigma-70 factor, ECF subfamily